MDVDLRKRFLVFLLLQISSYLLIWDINLWKNLCSFDYSNIYSLVFFVNSGTEITLFNFTLRKKYFTIFAYKFPIFIFPSKYEVQAQILIEESYLIPNQYLFNNLKIKLWTPVFLEISFYHVILLIWCV